MAAVAPTVTSLRSGLVIAQAELDLLGEQARLLDEAEALKAIERARDDLLEAWGRLGETRAGDAYYLPDAMAQP